MIDLGSTGFVFDAHWYWDLFEGGTTIAEAPAAHAMRELLLPLARIAKGRFAIDAIESDADGGGVRFVVADHPSAIRFATAASDRAIVERFVGALNTSLAAAEVGHVFAIVVPRRYEVRGVLIPDDELAALAQDPSVRMPSDRGPWRTRASRPALG